MQFDAWHQKYSSNPGLAEESDEEIRCLQAQINEKRRQKLSAAEATTACVCASHSIPESKLSIKLNKI